MPPLDIGPPPLVVPKAAIIRPADNGLLRQAMLPGTVPIGNGRLRLHWLGLVTSDADQTTYSWGNFAAPCAGLMIVETWARTAGGSNETVASVSIGGTNGTIHNNPSGGEDPICIASRVVGAGSQAVSSTFTAGRSRAAAAVWFLAGYQAATPVATAGRNDSVNRTSQTATIDTSAGGIAVFLCWSNNETGTWNNGVFMPVTPPVIEGGSTLHAGYVLPTPAATATAYTCSWTGTIASGIVGGSWR